MIEKTGLLQENITHPTAGFEVFVNKKVTFNCSINEMRILAHFGMISPPFFKPISVGYV